MTTGRGSGDSKGLGRWVWGAGIGFFCCRVQGVQGVTIGCGEEGFGR